MIYRPSSGAKIKINAANHEKGLAARVFGIPDWSRTNGLSLRRRPLYPTELPGHIQKLFNFPPLQETNDLPLRRRPLYPAELRKRTLIVYTNPKNKSSQKQAFRHKTAQVHITLKSKRRDNHA